MAEEKEYEQKIRIVVYGVDTKGEMFQEDTSTRVVAHTWARIALRHGVESGADLILFNKENGSQAEFIVEGTPAPNEVKLQLRDHTVDIWQLDFGVPPPPKPDLRPQLHLECMNCHTREVAPIEEYELEKLERTGRVTRHCATCGCESEWEKESVAQARVAAAEEKRVVEAREHAEVALSAARQAETEAREQAERAARDADAAGNEALAAEEHRREAQKCSGDAGRELAAADLRLHELTQKVEAARKKQAQGESGLPSAAAAYEEAVRNATEIRQKAEAAIKASQELTRQAEELAKRAAAARAEAEAEAQKAEQARAAMNAAHRAVEELRAGRSGAERDLSETEQAFTAAQAARAAAVEKAEEARRAAEEAAKVAARATQVAAGSQSRAQNAAAALATAVQARESAERVFAEVVAVPEAAAAQPAAAAATTGAVAASPAPVAPAEPAAAVNWVERRASRRIAVKTSARVRRASGSEVVAPINVSRGGICFESRASYELDEVVFVAMHYRAGSDALDTAARIVRVARGSGKESGYSYGVKFET